MSNVNIRFPNAPERYDQRDQDQFRREVERALQQGVPLGITGGGSGTLAVLLGGAAFAANIGTLDFASADFDLTETPAGEVNIGLDASVSRVGHTHAKVDLPAAIAYEDEANIFGPNLAQDFNVGTAYLIVRGDSGVADRGGILLNNSTGAVRHWKETATFTGAPGTSSRYRAGWVTDADKETFLNAGAAIEVGPANAIGLNLGGTGLVTVGSSVVIGTDVPAAAGGLRIGDGTDVTGFGTSPHSKGVVIELGNTGATFLQAVQIGIRNTSTGGVRALSVKGETAHNSPDNLSLLATSLRASATGSGTLPLLIGVDGVADLGATFTGVVTTMTASRAFVFSNVGAAGSVTTMQGFGVIWSGTSPVPTDAVNFEATNPTTGVNRYGLRVAAISGGTSNYAIYTNAGLVRFGDTLQFSPAASKIVPGATSLSLRNNTDSADNLLLTDAGVATFRNSVTLGLGGTLTVQAQNAAGGEGGEIQFSPGSGGTIWALDSLGSAPSRLRFHNGGQEYVTVRPGGTTLEVVTGDFKIASLGVFDSTDTPTDQQLLVYHAGAVNKWQAESIQFVRGSGDFKAALLADNTAVAYVLLDPGAGADSPVGAPPGTGAITVEIGHKAFTLSIPAYTKPADFRYFEWQTCTGASCVSWAALAFTTSRAIVHSRLTTGEIKRYRVRAVDRAGNASAFVTTGDNTVAAQSDTQAFAGIIAGELAAVDLTALAGDIGILVTGQMRGSGNTYGINFGGVGGIPAGWTAGINFEDTSLVNMTRYLNFHNGGAAGGTFLKHERLQVDFDGTVLMYQTSAQPLFKINATDFLLQNDAASPVHGILLDGTRPASWKRYLDLVDGVLTIKDNQGSPVTRVQAGMVGAGAMDYGLQVFDSAAATIMDFTGAKRILAVPVQPSSDSGASISIDLSTGLTQQVRLTSNTATVTLQNPVNGGRYRIWFQQDTVGSRPFPTMLGPNGEVFMYTNDTPPVLTTSPGVLDLFEFEYRTDPTTRFTVMALQTNVILPTPQVQGTPTGTSVSVASVNHNILMPATVNAGDLLLMFVAFHATQGTITTPSGWTSKGATGLATVFTKSADGTEDGTTVNVITVNSVKAAAHVYRIARWGGDAVASVTVAFNSGAPGTSADPDAVTPAWSNDRNLWIAGVSVTANPAITDPANYGTFIQTDDGAATTRLRTGRRVLYAATENPAAFTWTGTQTWTAITVAVRPPA